NSQINMSHKTAAMDQPVKFSRKCRECGLRNFIDATVCRRCEADLSQRPTRANESTKPKDIEQIPEQPVEPGQSKGRSLSILAAALVILFALVLFYVRQSSQESEPMAGQVDVAQSATQSDESAQDTSIEYSPSAVPAKQVLVVLNRFQDT